MIWNKLFEDNFATDAPLGSFSGAVGGGNLPLVDRHFDGLPAEVDAKWWAYPDGYTDSTKRGTYMPSMTVCFEKGCAKLSMFTDPPSRKILVAALFPKVPGAAPMGGFIDSRFEIQYRCATPTPNYKVAWLLWPDSKNWPNDGEIDFPEADCDKVIRGFVHRQGALAGSDQTAFKTQVPFADDRWRTCVIERLHGAVTLSLDGTVIGTTTARVPTGLMHWVIQCETGIGTPKPAPTARVDIEIKRVEVCVPA